MWHTCRMRSRPRISAAILPLRPLARRPVAELVAGFLGWSAAQVLAGRVRDRTHEYYHAQLSAFLAEYPALGRRSCSALRPVQVESLGLSWHRLQSLQRAFSWGVSAGLLASSPIAGVKRPEPGRRERVLSRAELVRLLRAASPDFRRFLLAMRATLARPQEVREFRWEQLQLLDGDRPAFVLSEFKGRKRRRETQAVRIIPVDRRLFRLLARLPFPAGGTGPVFTTARGEPWTTSAVMQRMRRLRKRLGLAGDVVAYTMRHTAATTATANGVTDRRLADLMGHTSTRTTQRYQHLQAEHLVEAIDQATARRKKVP